MIMKNDGVWCSVHIISITDSEILKDPRKNLSLLNVDKKYILFLWTLLLSPQRQEYTYIHYTLVTSTITYVCVKLSRENDKTEKADCYTFVVFVGKSLVILFEVKF